MKELKLVIHFEHEILREKTITTKIVMKKVVGRSYIVYSLELIAQPISQVQPTDSNMHACHMNSVLKIKFSS